MAAPAPRMHGLTHVPGGSDPIPGLGAAAAAFPAAIAEIAAAHPGSLRGYWRLGDGGLGPYADSKPAGPWANVPMVRINNTVDMTDLPAGALPPTDDDGAVQFNSSTGSSTSDHLSGSNTWGSSPTNPFESGFTELTVMGWVKPSASGSTFDGAIFSYLNNTGSLVGYCLGVAWPTRNIFWRGATRLLGPVLEADEWVFACAVHDATSDRIYLNGALVATGSATVGATGNAAPTIGGVWTNTSVFNVLYGAVDEVSMWADALTDSEIATLAKAAGLGTPGPPGPQGPPGATGPQGPAGPPGPNLIDGSTPTPLTGLLKGNGTDVDVAVAGTDYYRPGSPIAIDDIPPAKACRVGSSVNVSVPSGVDLNVPFDIERFDTDNIHNPAVNPARLTCQTQGFYLISATVQWQASTSGSFRQLAIFANAAASLGSDLRSPTPVVLRQTVSTVWFFVVGDFVTLTVHQDSGGPLNLEVSPYNSPELVMCRVG